MRAVIAGMAITGVLALSGTVATSAQGAVSDFVANPVDYVNTLNGTGTGGPVVGSINNFPGPTVPFGMVQFAPDTPSSYSGYIYSDKATTGFSMTHASVGCSAFGDIPMLPTTKSVTDSLSNVTESIAKDDGSEQGEPGYYTARLADSDIKAELTATTRVGYGRFTFPNDGKAARIDINAGGSKSLVYGSTVSIDPATRMVTGSVTTGNFCSKGNRYTLYFATTFDKDFTEYGTSSGSTYVKDSTSANATKSKAIVFFAPGSTVESRTAISYVSIDGAKKNLAAEGENTFDATRQAARNTWNGVLKSIQVAGRNKDDLETFYTSLYRSLVHPNTYNDVDGSYHGFDEDGTVHQVAAGHVEYTNYSDWDTYRSLAPLDGMLFPDRASDMAQSLVDVAEQAGSLPRWMYVDQATGQMTGDNPVPFIANLYTFGARDFDTAAALKYMIKGATVESPTYAGYVERPGIETYLEKHYLPQIPAAQGDHGIVGASITEEWSIDDFAISRFADALGDTKTVSEYQARSQYWMNLFNPKNLSIWPRNLDGSFVDDSGGGFGQTGFDEGSSEQYLWMVPHNISTLIHLLGGAEKAVPRLDTFFTELNAGANEPYMWAGNEPCFGTPWLYNFLGQPWKTQDVVNRIRTTLFGPAPDGEPGNDDLGAQSSWYVWAAIGLYPFTPASPTLTVNTPQFDRVRVAIGGGKAIDISAPGASSGKKLYIDSMAVNGSPSNLTYLPDDAATKGATVEYSLSAKPNTSWGTSPDSAPPSYPQGADAFKATWTDDTPIEVAPKSSVDVTAEVVRLRADVTDFSGRVTSAERKVTGTVTPGTFDSSGKGTATVTVTVAAGTPRGEYPLEVSLVAGGQTLKHTLTVTVTGNPAATKLTLAADSDVASAGAPITLSAEMSPKNALGTVTLFDGSKKVESASLDAAASGKAQWVIEHATVGAHRYSATFKPRDGKAFAPTASNEVTVTVNPAGPPSASDRGKELPHTGGVVSVGLVVLVLVLIGGGTAAVLVGRRRSGDATR